MRFDYRSVGEAPGDITPPPREQREGTSGRPFGVASTTNLLARRGVVPQRHQPRPHISGICSVYTPFRAKLQMPRIFRLYKTPKRFDISCRHCACASRLTWALSYLIDLPNASRMNHTSTTTATQRYPRGIAFELQIATVITLRWSRHSRKLSFSCKRIVLTSGQQQ